MLVKRGVEVIVELTQALQGTLRAASLKPLVNLLQGTDVLSAQMGNRVLHCQAFQCCADDVELRHLPWLDLGYPDAAVGVPDDQSLHLKPPQGFTDRRGADAQPVSQF